MFEFGHTPYTQKQIVELAITSLATNIVSGTNCMSVKPQNGPTLREYTSQGFHIVLGKA